MSRAARVVGGGLLVLALLGGSFWAWATSASQASMRQVVDAHRVDLPIPMPLSDAEVAELRAAAVAASAAADPAVDPLAGVDLKAIAQERAAQRGKHLVEARFVCVECHGADFGGGTMLDDPAMGALRGPNLTTGKGSVTLEYTPADWDRAVRHGLRKDGTASVMPADDFMAMSDRELSDVITYLRTMPPVDRSVVAVTPGPLFVVLTALGQIKPAAVDIITDHKATHPVEPPATAETAAFGKTIANVCTGCHNPELSGGPIVRGAPDWPAASNLTPAGNLARWSFEEFSAFLDTGKLPDGREVKAPMSLTTKYTKNMTLTERKALWAYLKSVPAKPTPG